ncbi:MAG: ribose 5-phosphate isomerase B [Pseudomonadota bacterium]
MVKKMRIIIGSDHGGFELKEYVKQFLSKDMGIDIYDVGTSGKESVDYPLFGSIVSQKVQSGEFERGILICGTGIGMSIVANRFFKVRAALCHDSYTARMSREHNDANILVLGGRVIDKGVALEIVKVWVTTEFQGGRHQQRLEKITDIEKTICDSKYNKPPEK